MSSKKSPRVKDEQRAQLALERWVQQDKACGSLSRAIRKAQATLRRTVSDEAWTVFLGLEELINTRHVEVVRAALLRSPSDRRRPAPERATPRRRPATKG